MMYDVKGSSDVAFWRRSGDDVKIRDNKKLNIDRLAPVPYPHSGAAGFSIRTFYKKLLIVLFVVILPATAFAKTRNELGDNHPAAGAVQFAVHTGQGW